MPPPLPAGAASGRRAVRCLDGAGVASASAADVLVASGLPIASGALGVSAALSGAGAMSTCATGPDRLDDAVGVDLHRREHQAAGELVDDRAVGLRAAFSAFSSAAARWIAAIAALAAARCSGVAGGSRLLDLGRRLGLRTAASARGARLPRPADRSSSPPPSTAAALGLVDGLGVHEHPAARGSARTAR